MDEDSIECDCYWHRQDVTEAKSLREYWNELVSFLKMLVRHL